MRLWFFSSAVNSFFKRGCAAIQWGKMSDCLVGPFVYYHTSSVRTANICLCRTRPQTPKTGFLVTGLINKGESEGMGIHLYSCLIII